MDPAIEQAEWNQPVNVGWRILTDEVLARVGPGWEVILVERKQEITQAGTINGNRVGPWQVSLFHRESDIIVYGTDKKLANAFAFAIARIVKIASQVPR